MAKLWFKDGKMLSWSRENAATAALMLPGVVGVIAVTIAAQTLPPGVTVATLDEEDEEVTYDPTEHVRTAALAAIRLDAIGRIFANAHALIDTLITIADGDPALSGPQQAKVATIRDDFLPILALTAPGDLAQLETDLMALIGKVAALPAPAPVTVACTIVEE